jgi:putative transposase
MLKAHDLITSPQFTVMQAADKFQHPTSRVHELWQTDFTYFRVVGWGWYFLSTILDDYSRYIITWRLTTTMTAADVTGTWRAHWKRQGYPRPGYGTNQDYSRTTGPATSVAN